jgi:hypothetical protein
MRNALACQINAKPPPHRTSFFTPLAAKTHRVAIRVDLKRAAVDAIKRKPLASKLAWVTCVEVDVLGYDVVSVWSGRAATASLLACVVGLWGCGPQEQGGEVVEIIEDECGGFGHLHDDHCHCDEGYTPTADQRSCVEEGDPDPDPADQGGPLTFEPGSVRGAVGETEGGQSYWVVEGLDEGTHIQVELYPEYGGPDQAGTHTLGQDDESYATCGTCVVLRTGCVLSGGFYDCERTFMPIAGASLQLDQIGDAEGGKLVGSLEDVTFEQVTIERDFSTTPVEDGASHTLARWAFDVVLGGSDIPEPECSGHGHLHGNTCHCDPGYTLDPNDSGRCVSSTPEPECSGHGHLHGNHCHCDPGYRNDPNDPTKCIP